MDESEGERANELKRLWRTCVDSACLLFSAWSLLNLNLNLNQLNMKILVGLDDSPSAEFAFTRALELAQAERASNRPVQLYIVAVPELLSDMFALYANPHLLSNINHRISEKTEALARRFVERCSAADVRARAGCQSSFVPDGRYCADAARGGAARGTQIECVTHIDHGVAREVIMQAINLYKIDLVVLGRSGSGGLERKLKDVLGSTSAHITQHAPCSVLIVKSKDEDTVTSSQ